MKKKRGERKEDLDLNLQQFYNSSTTKLVKAYWGYLIKLNVNQHDYALPRFFYRVRLKMKLEGCKVSA